MGVLKGGGDGAPNPDYVDANPVGLGQLDWCLQFEDHFLGTALNLGAWENSFQSNNVTHSFGNTSVAASELKMSLPNSTSGVNLNTKSARLAVGGYAEARIKFPGSGVNLYNWPAWWTTTDLSSPWPNGGELDIAEPIDTMSANYHALNQNPSSIISGTWSAAYHVYGVWRKSRAQACFYYDGVLVWQTPTNDTGAPHYLMLTLGDLGGFSGSKVYGASGDVYVDYVRCWS